MPKRVVMVIRVGFLGVILMAQLVKGQVAAQNESQPSLLVRLESSDWEVRYETAKQLRATSPDRLEPEIKEKLIQLLETENRRLWEKLEGKVPAASYSEIGGEGFAEYYAELIGLVSSLRDDLALPALVNSASEPDTELDSELAGYGTRVVEPAIARLHQLAATRISLQGFEGVPVEGQKAMADILAKVMIENAEQRLKPPLSTGDLAQIKTALRPLLSSQDKWLQLYGAFGLALAKDGAEAQQIRNVFLVYLNDKRPGARLTALGKLIKLTDAQFIPVDKLKELAEKDGFHVEKTSPQGAALTEYPVRQLATEIIHRLSKQTTKKTPTA